MRVAKGKKKFTWSQGPCGDPARTGNKPLIVLASGKNDFPKELDSLYKPGGIKALYAEKIAQKRRMAALSTNGKFVLAVNNIHEIQIENPELVIKAIREVIDAYKTKKHLSFGQLSRVGT